MVKNNTGFKPLVKRVNTIIIVSLALGIGIVIFSLAAQLFFVINIGTTENAEDKGEIAKRAVETVMLEGRADFAIEFLDRIKSSELGNTIQIYRSNGVPAFSDSATRDLVNSRIGFERFTHSSMLAFDVEEANMDYLRHSAGEGQPPGNVLFRHNKDGESFLTLYSPLINGPNCIICHGQTPTVRGVVGVSYDISHINRRQQLGIIISVVLLLALVSILTFVLSRFMREKVLYPVREIGDVCLQVTQGDFSPRVHLKNRDEIGTLADTVNTMVEGLYERFELSKYVSSSTIKSLRDEKHAKKTELTMFFSDVRGFTSYSENNTADTVVDNLNKLMNFQTDIIHNYGGDIDKYVGDEVVAVFSEDDSIYNACKSALEIQRSVAGSSEFDNLEIGIGINTGEVIFGRIGSEKRADFTVIGDNVNVTSRLCSAAKGGQIIISESSWKKVKDKVNVDGPFKLTVKGKAGQLRVFLLKGLAEDMA